MAKLRKMLGSADAPVVNSLMRLIETQSRETLAKWGIEYAEKYYVPILKSKGAYDERINNSVSAVHDFLGNKLTLKEITPILKAGTAAAQELEDDPISRAAARAVITACGIGKNPANSLGFCFYGAAAYAYSTAGISETAETYDKLADTEFNRILETLRFAAVENEINPVKINWNC